MAKVFLSIFIFILVFCAMIFGVVFGMPSSIEAMALDKAITITAVDKQHVYGEETKTLEYVISGEIITLEEEELLNIRLLKSEGGEVGQYDITVLFDVIEGITVSTVNGVYTITPAIYDTRDLFFGNQTVTYDGMAKSIFVEGYIPDEITVSYASNGQTNAGEYLVSAIFESTSNYTVIGGTRYATLSIRKADIDIGGLIFSSGTFTYDGTPKSLKVVGSIPDTVSIRYQGNLAQSAGTYRVTAIIDYDKSNYKLCSGEYELAKNHLYAEMVINKARSVINVDKNSYSKIYDGTSFSIPASVTGEDNRNMVFLVNETLSSNKFTEIGNYDVAITTIGTNNYLPAKEVSVNVKILMPALSVSQNNLKVLMLSETGFDAATNIVITKSTSALVSIKQSPLRKIAAVYTILLFCSGEIIDIPNDTTLVITSPEGRNLTLYYNSEGRSEEVPFTQKTQGEMVFQADKLGMFVVYKDDYQLYWIVGLFICIIAMLALIVGIAIYRSKTYKIEFISNIIGYKIPSLVSGVGQPITIPQANFGSLIFEGWYLDSTFNNKLVMLDIMPQKDIKLYAKWGFRPIGKYKKFTDLDLF